VVKASNDRVEFRKEQVNQCLQSLAIPQSFPFPGFRRESTCTGKRNVVSCGNTREHTSEERELVYEIIWIPELGLWRRFLRSQRKLQS
jgi:hypothetical protein